MDTNSKKETSANGDQPMKMGSRFKYDILVYLQEAERALLTKRLLRARSIVRLVTNELDQSQEVQSQEQVAIRPLLQEADKALFEGKAAVVHSCLRKAITELTV